MLEKIWHTKSGVWPKFGGCTFKAVGGVSVYILAQKKKTKKEAYTVDQ